MEKTTLPEIPTDSRAEDAVDDWVCGRVEWRHRLDERADLVVVGDDLVQLQQVVNEERTPAQNEHWMV